LKGLITPSLQTATLSPIGIELTAGTLAAAQWQRRGSQLRLSATAFMERSLKPADDVLPTAVEWRRFVQMLERRGFIGDTAVLTMPESRLHTAVLELPPKRSGAPLAQIAAAELARMSKRDVGGLETRMWELPMPVRGTTETTHAMVLACDGRDAMSMVANAEEAGLLVAALDVRCCALARALERVMITEPDRGDHAAVAIDLSAGGGLLVAVRQSDALATSIDGSAVAQGPQRHIVYERGVADVGVGRLLGRVRELCGCSDAEARLILTVGLDEGSPYADVVTPEVANAIREYADGVAVELGAAAGFLAHRYPGRVSLVAVCGLGAMVPGLVGLIARRLSGEAERCLVLTPGLLCSGSLADAELRDPRLTIPCGLALHGGEVS
jgi:hypothetical protein